MCTHKIKFRVSRIRIFIRFNYCSASTKSAQCPRALTWCQTNCKGAVCDQGKYFAAAQTAPVTCTDCEPGRHQDGTGQTDCKGDLCAAGKFKAVVAQKNPVTCDDCGSGQYQPATGQLACIVCTAGKYRDTSAAAFVSSAEEVACKACGPGEYTSVDGLTACTGNPCVAGKFFEQIAQTALVTCKDCVAGQYQGQTGQVSCVACGTGEYQPARAQSACIACLNGKYRDTSAAASSADAVEAGVVSTGTPTGPGSH